MECSVLEDVKSSIKECEKRVWCLSLVGGADGGGHRLAEDEGKEEEEVVHIGVTTLEGLDILVSASERGYSFELAGAIEVVGLVRLPPTQSDSHTSCGRVPQRITGDSHIHQSAVRIAGDSSNF